MRVVTITRATLHPFSAFGLVNMYSRYECLQQNVQKLDRESKSSIQQFSDFI